MADDDEKEKKPDYTQGNAYPQPQSKKNEKDKGDFDDLVELARELNKDAFTIHKNLYNKLPDLNLEDKFQSLSDTLKNYSSGSSNGGGAGGGSSGGGKAPANQDNASNVDNVDSARPGPGAGAAGNNAVAGAAPADWENPDAGNANPSEGLQNQASTNQSFQQGSSGVNSSGGGLDIGQAVELAESCPIPPV